VQLKYFPLRTILYGQLFTAYRYLIQAYGAIAGKGAAGGFTTSHSKLELVTILCRAWFSALSGIPVVWRKRKSAWKTKAISGAELLRCFKLYGVGARQIGLKE
jgi:hypothetical protein